MSEVSHHLLECFLLFGEFEINDVTLLYLTCGLQIFVLRMRQVRIG